MDINEEIQKATDKLIVEKLPSIIEEKATKMLDSILDDIFRTYSDMGKGIKTKIEQHMNINLQQYDMVDYNAMVAKAINERLVGLVNEQSIKPIMKLVEDTVGFVEKKKMKLSDIHEMIKSASEEDSDEAEGAISFHVNENTEYGWFVVSLDLEEDRSADECDLEFLISSERKTIFSFKAKNWRSDKRTKLTPAKVTQLSNLEHRIFRLYSAQVEIEVDETSFYNEWSRYN